MDAFNRRMVKKNGTTAEQYYLWNQNGQLIGVANGSGVLTASFVYGSKSHVPDYMITDTADYQIVSDHLGSSVAVVNSATGVVAQEIKYDEFGRITADTNPGFIPFGFAGCLYDQDTKLCRFGARDYDASIGRWTAKDPILFAGGDENLYGYVANDPVNWIDVEGLTKKDPSDGAGYGGTGGGTIYVAPNGQAALAPPGSTVSTASNGRGLKINTPNGTQIRLMEPNRMSPNGYGTINKNGQYVDPRGNPVKSNSPDAHIQPTSCPPGGK